MAPYGSGMPYINYPMGPMDMPYPGVIPPDPFGVGMNMVPPVRSREEFEVRKAELRRQPEREFSRDRELGMDSINAPELPSIPRSVSIFVSCFLYSFLCPLALSTGFRSGLQFHVNPHPRKHLFFFPLLLFSVSFFLGGLRVGMGSVRMKCIENLRYISLIFPRIIFCCIMMSDL